MLNNIVFLFMGSLVLTNPMNIQLRSNSFFQTIYIYSKILRYIWVN